MPNHIQCNHCVIQWRYKAGNSWGYMKPDYQGGLKGGGKQEEFVNCADVAVLSSPSNQIIPLQTTIPSTRPTSQQLWWWQTSQYPVTKTTTKRPDLWWPVVSTKPSTRPTNQQWWWVQLSTKKSTRPENSIYNLQNFWTTKTTTTKYSNYKPINPFLTSQSQQNNLNLNHWWWQSKYPQNAVITTTTTKKTYNWWAPAINVQKPSQIIWWRPATTTKYPLLNYNSQNILNYPAITPKKIWQSYFTQIQNVYPFNQYFSTTKANLIRSNLVCQRLPFNIASSLSKIIDPYKYHGKPVCYIVGDTRLSCKQCYENCISPYRTCPTQDCYCKWHPNF